MKSKYFIAEQVRLKLEAGYGKTSSKVQFDDIKAALEQKINAKYRTEQFSVNLPGGETIPDGLFLAPYTGIPVSPVGKRSEAILPIIPISLLRNMGVYQVYDPNSPNVDFIPVQAGQLNMVDGQQILCSFMGQVAYEVKGQKLVFNKNITIDGISSVDAMLIVMDLSKYDDFTPLPIPASMESELVEELYVDFSRVMGMELNKKVDNYNPDAK